MNIAESIHESLSRWGGRPAMIELYPDRAPVCLSAGELQSRVDEMEGFLRTAGIQNNSIVALVLDNSSDYAVAFLALIGIGAKPVPIHTAWRAMELDEIFSNARPCAVISETRYLDMVKPYAGSRVVVERHHGKWRLHHPDVRGRAGDPADVDESLASINYTYRGYGYPLGAMVSHGQYLTGAKVLVDGLRPGAGEKMLVVLPFTYIFPMIGCLCVPLLYGITTVLSPTVNPLQIFSHIRSHEIEIITAVPEIYELMCNLKDESILLPSLKVFVSGGSRLSGEQYERIRRAFDVELLHGYGLTEFTPVSRNMRSEGRPGTIGPLCGGIECRIDHDSENNTGEILIRAAHMTRAYYRRPAETAGAFENGWFRTGDNGCIRNGHLVFAGEKKSTRKVKGNMVDLEEVRRALLMHPEVQGAEVDCSDNVLSARIRIDSGGTVQERVPEIKKFLEDRIARFKIPAQISGL